MIATPPPQSWSRRRQRDLLLVHRAAVVQSGCRWGRPWRGWDGQAFARTVEDDIRHAAVARVRWARRHLRLGVAITAAALGLGARTLRGWVQAWRDGRRRRPRGAPPGSVSRQTRDQVFYVLCLTGPSVPLRVLQAVFHEVPRAFLDDFRKRFKAMLRRRRRACVHVLRWPRVGAVWAADLREEDAPTDGRYPYTLLVRDLGSGRMLAAVPIETKEARHVVAALRRLFALHGPPIIFKTDNGGEFVAGCVQELLKAHGVLPLLSPPYMPSYNGAIEAGGGQIAVRAWEHAARHDRPEQWTCDDLIYAQEHGNATARPHGYGSPTPDDLWERRVPVTPHERAALKADVERIAAPERYYTTAGADGPLDPWHERDIGRAAIVQALIDNDYLQIRRRRISPPISAARWSRIA